MLISKKSRYALRAVFELSKRKGDGPVKIADIARPQIIPQKFLETILCQLKQAGFVESMRGSDGGYLLTRDPEALTVGEILRTVQGLPDPVDCFDEETSKCPLRPNCVFVPMWDDMRKAISSVYDATTFGDLVKREKENTQDTEHLRGSCDYAI